VGRRRAKRKTAIALAVARLGVSVEADERGRYRRSRETLRGEGDDRLSGLRGGEFREADAIRWNSLLSESVFPPTCAPHTLQV
jgi:hypothetical protein